MAVNDFSKKRLTEYLKPGMRVLIEFDKHGIGDMIMFQPLYQRLKELYPDVEFHLKGNTDQQYFEETPDAPVDMAFSIHFPEAPGLIKGDKYCVSKPEACALFELGIPWEKSLEFTWKPPVWNHDLKIRDNCIGFVFQVNSDPSKGLRVPHAAVIWQKIKNAGFTPIEVQFLNRNANSKNGRCAFVDYSCRDIEATPENMISVIKQCRGFIGVNTGTFCAATCIKEGKVLALKTRHPFAPFYKRFDPVPEMDCTIPEKTDYRMLTDYLEDCKDRRQPLTTS